MRACVHACVYIYVGMYVCMYESGLCANAVAFDSPVMASFVLAFAFDSSAFAVALAFDSNAFD